ncbi:hypothetical protein [Microbulbifer epialgicus]|uniref:Curlin associated repeat-containing protein n=1 Tax=Microbulbifer epialgicus TaxID=393907 RepID=A0ABV4P2L7_9GAMM
MKTLTPIAAAMLVAFSVNTFADNNMAILIQVGNGNMADADQSDPTILNNLIVQTLIGTSNNSAASQTTGTSHSMAANLQVGELNSSNSLQQSDTSFSSIFINQVGSMNEADIIQLGSALSLAFIAQLGIGNMHTATQSGVDQTARVVQIGNDNMATITQ